MSAQQETLSEPRPLHIMLFGLPQAGKSALLGALAQAAQTQSQPLGFRILDFPEDLRQLQKALYDKGPPPTREAVVTHAVTFEPNADGTRPATKALLLDCSGQAAAQLLADKGFDSLGGNKLAQAIFDADTLLVVVDGSGDSAHLNKSFAEFATFLRLLQEHRSERTEATGLPVYLVMTKSDLLARSSDTANAWLHRIQERKQHVQERFEQFLAKDEQAPASSVPSSLLTPEEGFGKLELHVWATAIGRPALADRPARPTEPYGVAELFRQCVHSAEEYRERRERASRRLQWAVFGAGGLVALLLLLAVGFYVTRPDPHVTALENEARLLLPHPADKPALRLKEPLGEKLRKLRNIKESSKFDRLPSEVREQVVGYLAEIEAYQAYDKDFLARVQPEPQYATRDRDLDDVEKALGDVPLPPRYAAAWTATKVGQRLRQWAKDVEVLRETVARSKKWYRQQKEYAAQLYEEGLRLSSKEKPASKQQRLDWLERVHDLNEQAWPHEPSQRILGTSGITYATAYNFDQVIEARNDLIDRQRQLEPLVKLVAK